MLKTLVLAFLSSHGKDQYALPKSSTSSLIPGSNIIKGNSCSSTKRMVHVEKRLEELGIKLPPAPKAAANYVPCQQSGNLLYLSGHMPMNADGKLSTGKLGSDETKNVDYGYDAAKLVGLNLIATMKKYLGDLDDVEQIVKVFGIVSSSDDFHNQHLVVNGCSDLLNEVFQERGTHARSAIGTNSLPLDLSVEIEAIVRVSSNNSRE